ncbi:MULTISPECIES: TetR family transcriptional regulator [unclassified Actinomyces]|uniref:TetR family transcriptional regulator n=1 Tax=unclassified Actinomyces TaxID=2609248 RepID=UPI002016C476|nr:MULTISPECIES: TetR family transcriptional regulator [unclassified Actinomyces]MCL3777401.1 TetR family transcriptional regulator [Actinomyces sp. AC-20-1]MCL3789077.1 TetR family transcriptional regulator [Actinomyces sp. 187325]MCL3791650.1 TetR family transcriptional regulator [Actinomyces sp. 186855]MCL3793878.1 TetR family transcriptional regulator [Actinomyces sp. 217892]
MSTAAHTSSTGPGHTRGPYAKTTAKRAAIARAAYEVVQEVGHEGLTTAAVAARAGMAERTMLYHFPTRDHLLTAALDHFDNVIQGGGNLEAFRRDHGVTADREPSLEESEETIRRLIAATASDDARLRLYSYLAGQAQVEGSAAHEHFTTHYAEAIDGIGALIRAFQKAGLARTDRDASSMARRFLASWDGLQQQWVVSGDFDLEEEILLAFADVTGRDLILARQAVTDALQALSA